MDDGDPGGAEGLITWTSLEHHEHARVDAPGAQAVGEQDELLLRTAEAELADEQAHATWP